MIFKIKYSLVTPARNEESLIRKTIQSVINQKIRPQKWIIIDDGSTDKTGEIIDSFAIDNKWIEVLHIEKTVSSYRGIQEKLWLAFDRIDIDENDFIGKLDADIELYPTYYEDLFRKFYEDKKLGIAGGTLFYIENGKKIVEYNPEYHVRGGLKLYRKNCWKDIGGMEFKLAYDVVDEIKASMLGWRTVSFRDIEALHHRPTGKQKGIVGWCIYRGKLGYMAGYHPLFLTFKCMKNIFKKPYMIGSLGEFLGFFSCYLDKTERTIGDPEFIKIFQKDPNRAYFFTSVLIINLNR